MSIAPYTREEIEIHKAVEGVGSGPKDRSIPYPGSIALRWLATVDARDAEIERLRERVAVEHSAGLHAEKVLAETGGKYLRELDRVERMREALIDARDMFEAIKMYADCACLWGERDGHSYGCSKGHALEGFAKIESALGGEPTKETT